MSQKCIDGIVTSLLNKDLCFVRECFKSRNLGLMRIAMGLYHENLLKYKPWATPKLYSEYHNKYKMLYRLYIHYKRIDEKTDGGETHGKSKLES